MTKMLKAVAIAALTVFGSANAALINKVDLFSVNQLVSDNTPDGDAVISEAGTGLVEHCHAVRSVVGNELITREQINPVDESSVCRAEHGQCGDCNCFKHFRHGGSFKEWTFHRLGW